ncbi:MAG: glycoside hydrolase family 2 protein, partial [Clostridia bacterium]|nr:glycoside hydrolase family 2 protein [Clostridia bacterium]
MRQITDINFDWRFSEHFSPEQVSPDFDDSDFAAVDIPHTVKEIPYNYFDEKDYQFVSCYRKRFTLPAEATDGAHKAIMRFEGAANYARVYINGEFCCEHKDGYTPFEADITDLITDGENVIAVELDSAERPDMPPFGNVVDYLVYGGIYREVSIKTVPLTYIDDIFVRTPCVSGEKKRLVADVTFSQPYRGVLKAKVTDSNGNAVAERSAEVDGSVIRLDWAFPAKLWDLDSPVLYTLTIEIDGDEDSRRFGFRSAEFRKDGFYLNGRHVKLRGLNRHQSYPYVGNAMPKSAQTADAKLLKYELGCNIVRTSHYPDSPHFLDCCDEIGLLVFTEMPSWQHLGEGEWRETCLNNI